MMSDEDATSALDDEVEAELRSMARPGKKIAVGAAMVLVAGIVVLGSWALLNWRDSKAAEPAADEAGTNLGDGTSSEQPQSSTSPLGKVFTAPDGSFSAAF